MENSVVIELNEEYRFTFCNAAIEKLSGKKKTELIGKTIWELFPKLSGSSAYQAITKAYTDKVETGVEFLTPLGNFWARMLVTPKDGGVIILQYELGPANGKQELHEEHRRLKEAQAIGHVGSFEWIVGSNISHWSDELFRINGLEPQSEEISLDKVDRFIYPADFDALQAARDQSFQQPGYYKRIHRIIKRDGEVRWVNHEWESFANVENRVVKVTGVVQDITERKRAEQEIKESKELLNGIAEAQTVSISAFNPIRDESGNIADLVFTYSNNVTTKISAVAALVGHRFTELFPGAKETMLPVFAKVINTGITADYEFDYDRDGIKGTFHIVAVKLGNGVMVSTEDITQRKAAEQQLIQLKDELAQKANDKYLALFNSIDEGFYLAEVIFDENDHPVDIYYYEENPAAVRILGIGVKGRKLTEVSRDYERYWYETFGDVALTGESKRLEQYAQHDKKWFNFYVTKIGDESSRQVAIVFQDITDLKRARQEVEQSRDLLQSVFDASYNGLSVLKSVRNERGEIVDMEYLFANQVTKRTNKRYDLEGKLYSQVHAGFKGTDYFEVVRQVVETGEPHQYQLHYHFEHLDNWFNITTVKLNDGVVISFEDISEIKKAEIVLRKSEERKTFLLQLSDVLRPLTHPDEIQAAATRTAMTYFGADRCYYCEIEKDTATIRRDAAKEDLPSVAASYPLSTMPIFKAVLDSGHPFVVHDSNAPDLLDENLRQICSQMQILSYVDVPVIKHGRPAGILCLTQCTPRTWTATEVELVEEIAERVWAAIERAKAEETLRESEEQKTFLLKLSDSMRPISDPMKIQAKACQTIAEYLQADRSYYGELEPDQDYIVVKQDYLKGDFPSLAGRHAIQSFGSIIAELREGHIATLEDNRTDSFLSDSERKNCEALYIRAFIAIPLIKGAKLVAYLGVTSATPRKWTVNEIELLKEVAERTWSSVERAKAEEALRQNEARLAIELANTQQLQYVSTRLIQENSIELLYDQILDAAMSIMQSDMVSLQMLVPEKNELLLLAWKGFHPESAKFWKWVKRDSSSSCGAALANCERIIVPDVDASAFMAGTEDLDSYHLSGIKAVQSTPLVSRSGKMVGMISCHWRKVHHPANHELGLLDTLGRQAADLIEQRQAGEALLESEEKYRTLFETMDEGFGIAEVIVDENNNPADYRWLELNQQFDKLTGASRELLLSGKTFLEILPEHRNTDRYKYYHQVASTGEPVRFEDYSKAFGRWFDMNIFRLKHSDKKQIAVLFTNVTERKRREAHMRFLAEITDEFSRLSSPDEVMQTVGEKIGSYMKVTSCNFVDIDETAEKEMIVSHSWYGANIPVFPGAFRIKDYLTEEFERANRAGETVVVCNTQTDDRTSALGYDALKINAFITVPFFRAGEWKYFLAVSCPEPRDWRADEVEFFKELADTIFPRLEQVRAIVALQESEARFRLMADAVPVSIWITDAEGRVEFLNKHWCDYAGITFEPTTAAAVAGDFLHPADARAVMAAFGAAMQAGKGFEVEQRNRSKTGEYRWFLNRAEPYLDPHSGSVKKWFGVGTDIHDRKLAEEKIKDFNIVLEQQVAERTFDLQRSRDLLQSVFDAAPNSITITKIIYTEDGEVDDFGILVFNEFTLKTTGLKAEEAIGKRYGELFPHSKEIGLFQKFVDVARTGEPAEVEFWYEGEGMHHWFYSRATKLGDLLVVTTEDITERKKAELEIQKNLTILQQAEDMAQIGSWEYDLGTGKFNWSEGMYNLFGLPQGSKVSPVTYLHFASGTDRAIARRIVKNLKKGEEAFEEMMHIERKDGQRLLKVKGAVALDEKGTAQRVLGVDVDVTDIKEAEQKLEESKRMLQQTAEASPDAITIYDLVTKQPVYLNNCLADWIGTTTEELLRMGVGGRLDIIDSEDRSALLDFNEKLKTSQDGILLQLEYRLHTNKDTIVWIRNRSKIFKRDKNGIVTHLLSFLQDVSEEKAAEQVLKNLNASLEKKNLELENKNEELSSFAFIASHDLKEPLRKVATFSNLLLEREEENLSLRGKGYLDRMKQSVKRMEILIDDVLALSRMQRKSGVIEDVDLNEILERTKEELHQQIKESGACIISDKMPVIKAYPSPIFYLFNNLIGNAIKYQQKESHPQIIITATRCKADEIINTAVRPDATYLKLSFKDNGIGFHQEYASQIFRLFQRLHDKDEYPGTGIGLTLCKKIMENHNGFITAESEPGKGSVFSCYFPL